MDVTEIKREVITVCEAIKILNVVPATFYKLQKRGEVPKPFTLGGRPYYLRGDIEGLKDGIKVRRGDYGRKGKGGGGV